MFPIPKNNDFDPIPYAEAIRRKPKPKQGFVLVTQVQWNEELEKEATQKVKFDSLPEEVDIILPGIINKRLPYGYEMDFHPSWVELRDKIYNPYKNEYSFEQLEVIYSDSEILHSLGIKIEMPNSNSAWYQDPDGIKPDVFHEDFWEWRHRFTEAWENWEYDIRRFFETNLDLFLHKLTISGETKNVPPPDKNQTVRDFLEKLNQLAQPGAGVPNYAEEEFGGEDSD